MGDRAPTFTVFTPTYNRAHTLPRVYASLLAQTLHDFEWLIVDDGSADGTKALVERWQAEAPFPVRYLHQPNQGKHIAFNAGVRAAAGRLFLTLDSDDECVPTALERFRYHWESIPPARRREFTGASCLCQYVDGGIVGDRFPRDVTDSDSLEIFYRYKVRGEKWGVHRVEVLREFPFPEDVKATHVPEALIWSRIARRYRTRFFNEALRIYYVDAPSLVNGTDPAHKALAIRLGHLSTLNEELDFFAQAPLIFFYSGALYARSCFFLGIRPGQQVRALRTLGGRLIWLLALPVGWAYYRAQRRGHSWPAALSLGR